MNARTTAHRRTHSPTTRGGIVALTSRRTHRLGVAILVMLSLLMGASAAVAPVANAAGDGPYNFSNSAIADRAEAYANGAYGGQCLVFATNMIKAAGGPQFYFGYDTSTYQAQWAQRAAPVGTLAETQRGDIVQWGGGAGGNPHTAIITTGGSSPQVIDSNFAYTEKVSRGSLSSHSPRGSVYRIWRVGKATPPPPPPPPPPPQMLVIRQGSSALMGKVGLNDSWVPLGALDGKIVASGNRLAVLTPAGDLYAKEPLNGVWIKEAAAVTDFAISG